jgi:hypothetical protein
MGSDAMSIPDYVAIGLLAACLTLWAVTALLVRKSLARSSGQETTERKGRKQRHSKRDPNSERESNSARKAV